MLLLLRGLEWECCGFGALQETNSTVTRGEYSLDQQLRRGKNAQTIPLVLGVRHCWNFVRHDYDALPRVPSLFRLEEEAVQQGGADSALFRDEPARPARSLARPQRRRIRVRSLLPHLRHRHDVGPVGSCDHRHSRSGRVARELRPPRRRAKAAVPRLSQVCVSRAVFVEVALSHSSAGF